MADDQEMTEEQQVAWIQSQLQNLADQGINITLQEKDVEWSDPYEDGSLTKWLMAAESGDLTGLQGVLEAHPDFDVMQAGPDGDTAIHLCSLYGHDELITFLLEKGAKADAVNDEDGSTPLHDAAASGYLEIVQALHAACADKQAVLDVKDFDGDTPLHNAARGDHTAIVEFMLQNGANPWIENDDEHTPKDEAEEAAVKQLLQEAMDKTPKPADG